MFFFLPMSDNDFLATVSFSPDVSFLPFCQLRQPIQCMIRTSKKRFFFLNFRGEKFSAGQEILPAMSPSHQFNVENN